MKVRNLVLSLIFAAGAQALAMPALEGNYTCYALEGGEMGDIEVKIREGKLYLYGFEAGNMTEDGLPCSNEKMADTFNGMEIIADTTCTDNTLRYKIAIKDPSKNTDLKMDLGMVLVDQNTMGLKLMLSGVANGTPLNETVAAKCLKK